MLSIGLKPFRADLNLGLAIRVLVTRLRCMFVLYFVSKKKSKHEKDKFNLFNNSLEKKSCSTQNKSFSTQTRISSAQIAFKHKFYVFKEKDLDKKKLLNQFLVLTRDVF